jgi:hypothetical protein
MMYGKSSDKEGNPVLLVWLDTLCCPVVPPEAKTKAIKKMRKVYSNADQVLVLDSGLQQYNVDGWDQFRVAAPNSIHPIELLLRIFTSGWMRRLWTFQEAALPRHLHFQFADVVISMEELLFAYHRINDGNCFFRGFQWDIDSEFNSLRSFFQNSDQNLTISDELYRLDKSLMYRSTSNASDEALCIASLIYLDLEKIATISGKDEIKQTERMKMVWKLIAMKGGVPANVLFYPSAQRIESLGWGWAPLSFLDVETDRKDRSIRFSRWVSTQLAKFEPEKGLRAIFPGFRLSRKMRTAIVPPGDTPWWNALPRRSEESLFFHDQSNETWYRIIHSRPQVSDEQETAGSGSTHPIRDLILQDRCAVVAKYIPGMDVRHDDPFPPHESSWISMGLVVSVLQTGSSEVTALQARIEHNVSLTLLTAPEILLYSTINNLAVALEEDPAARALADVRQPSDAGHQEAVSAFKIRAKAMMEEAYQRDSRLKPAVVECLGQNVVDKAYGLIGEWYHNHEGFVGERLSEEQIWYIV